MAGPASTTALRHPSVLLAMLLLAAAAGPAAADETFWVGQPGVPGAWTDPTNWSAGLPGSPGPAGTTQYARIENGGTAVITTSGPLHLGYYGRIGDTGSGHVIQDGGDRTYLAELVLGRKPGSHGTYTLNGGTLGVERPDLGYAGLFLGREGVGEFTQTGGTNRPHTLRVSDWSAGEGTYRLSGGILDVDGGFSVGISGTGRFLQTGGSVRHAQGGDAGLVIGASTGDGLYEMSGQSELTTNYISLGTHGGRALFRQNGGSVSLQNGGLLSVFAAGGSSRYEMSAGELSAVTISIGPIEGWGWTMPPVGTFDQSGGAVSTRALTVGPHSTYRYAGGSLAVASSMGVSGTLDFAGGNGLITVADSAAVNLAGASILNAQNARLHLGANTILRVDPGVDPAALFGEFSTGGIVHHAGDVLTVPAGTTMQLEGTWDDPFEVQGTLRAPPVPAGLTISRGVHVASGGLVDALMDPTRYTNMNRVTICDDRSGVEAGGTLKTEELAVGRDGEDGTFTQAGGTVKAGYVRISTRSTSQEPRANGTYILRGGTLDANSIGVAYAGPGALRQSGGTVKTKGLWIASGGAGTYEISGGSISITGTEVGLVVGGASEGVFRQTGGSVYSSLRAYIGYQGAQGGELIPGDVISYQPEGIGTYLLSDGSLSTGRELYVGYGGRGALEQTGGSVNASSVVLGAQGPTNHDLPPGIGHYVLRNGTVSSFDLKISINGKGTFSQYGGRVSNTMTRVGVQSGPTYAGEYELAGGELATTFLYIGDSAMLDDEHYGIMRQSGGAVTTQLLSVGRYGRYEMSGGSLTVGQTLVVKGDFDFANGNATLTLADGAGGNFSAGEVLNAGQASIVAGRETLLRFPEGFDPLTDLGHLETLGLVHVAGEVLMIPADGVVRDDGVLRGGLVNGGLLAPGHSPGVLTIQGAFEQSGSGKLVMELGAPLAGLYDQVVVTGLADLDGTLDIDLMTGAAPQLGQRYPVLQYASRSGTFSRITDTYIGNGLRFVPEYGQTGLTLVVAEVPEPSTLLLLAAGMLLARRRN